MVLSVPDTQSGDRTMGGAETGKAAVMARMGYERIMDATSFEAAGDLIEICLIAPSKNFPEWAVATHWNCDPEKHWVGSSQIEAYTDEAAARAGYTEAIARNTVPSPAP
jgi:hypothetical protein